MTYTLRVLASSSTTYEGSMNDVGAFESKMQFSTYSELKDVFKIQMLINKELPLQEKFLKMKW